MLTDEELSQLLENIRRPSRYTGGEVNSVRKDWGSVQFHLAMAFPDIYDIGMSHLGLDILCGIVNAREDSLAERAFMPWFDMEERLEESGVELFSLESRRGLKGFDAVGFSLQYELCYPTVLRMLDLAGIPRRREARRVGKWPLIIAGGPCAFNGEPMADFVDLIFVGDGEDSLEEFIEVWKEHAGEGRESVVREAARRVRGVYAPELYEACEGGAKAKEGAPEVVEPAVVRDLDGAYFPVAPVLPSVQAVHERVGLEVMRGCSRGCRFCQAGMTRRPVRVRSVGRLLELAEESYRNTGYDEISLLSLATGDYPYLEELTKRLVHRFEPLKVGLAFPSLRADAALKVVPRAMTAVRKSSMTVAVEAGSERLRRVINKGITEEGLLSGLGEAFEAGWSTVKLYFMAGLPTETIEDVAEIAELVEKVVALGRSVRGSVKVNVSVSPFIPKAGTPFQWEPMASREYLVEARELLHERLRGKTVKVSFHKVERSIVEAALARGGREVGAVLERAVESGCRLDAWDEGFEYRRWVEAFAGEGLDIEGYATRRLEEGAGTAWGHVSAGVSEGFLRREMERAREGGLTADCREGGCHGCGAVGCDGEPGAL